MSLRVVVGVSGGIAAYKAVSVVREFVQRGHHVTVVPTHSALRFVGAPTWEAISRNPVTAEVFDGVAEVKHVALGQSADLIVIAPASAHTLASLANGFAADLLGTTVLASNAPLVLAPAMHTEMWENPAVQANIATLSARGANVVGPDTGALTGEDVGVGRMSEPAEIVDRALASVRGGSLSGKKVLISGGGTREPLDPVRFLGNRSSGAMAVALAQEALARGAEVTLVHAHCEVPLPHRVESVPVSSSLEMLEAMKAHQAESDVIIMAAAVADWRAESVSSDKERGADLEDEWAPRLVRTPDISAELGADKSEGQILLCFAAETDPDKSVREQHAREKLERKQADAIVLNQVGDQVGFGEVETEVTLITASPQSQTFKGTKSSVAGRLWDALPEL
jgi:phosphopantothenoylcysteine decarboxylase/phosphopantothenate--cysteine ligase